MSVLPAIEQGLTTGERIAASTAPALVLCVMLLMIASAGVWLTVRRQRKWLEARLTAVDRKIAECERSHKACLARGSRRTSLLLQVLALAEPLVQAMRRHEDIARIAAIRAKVEDLLAEEADEAEAESAQ